MKVLQLGLCMATLLLAGSSHAVTTFDDAVTPDILFGAGNGNGGFTVDREGSVELGLRAKVRFPVPGNVFNSNGDGTYSFKAGLGATPDHALWAFEWSVNTDWNAMSGQNVGAYTYRLEIDYDPGAGTNFLAWDHISSPTGPIPFTPPQNPPGNFYDHSFGTNASPNGSGTEATSAATYGPLVAGNNVAQNSWRLSFFNETPFAFDPNATGTYDIRLTALSGVTEVAQVTIQVLVDGDVTPNVIYGSGNANGSFTLNRTGSVELGLRGKLRFPPSNIFNSNFDGTYTFERGLGQAPDSPVWAFDWSVNTDYNGMTGDTVSDFTYLLEIDYDPSAGTNFLAWDHLSSPTGPIPFTPPQNPPGNFYDHSFGTNATLNGGGTEATSAATYASLVAANNVAQNSWRFSFFNEPPFSFDPNATGRYDIRLTVFSGASVAAEVGIQVKVVVSDTCTVDADCDDGLGCNGMETCNLTTNQCEFGTPVVCSGQCLTCLDPSGTCQPVANGILCNDGQDCSVSDTCQGGICTPGAGGDADSDGDCDAEEAGCGCNPNDGAEICALPNRLVGLAGNSVGEVLLNWHTPTVRRVPVATDPSCQQSGTCASGRCTAGQINDLCTTSADCNLPADTCRLIVNYGDIADLALVFGKVGTTDHTALFLPAAPGCSRKVDVPLNPSRLTNRVRTMATGTVDGRLRRDRDNIIYK